MRLSPQNREDIEQYCLKAIDASDCDECPITDKERLQFVYERFFIEYGHNIKRMGEYKAFSEWLAGLPSCYNIDFENNILLNLAEKWGQPTTTDREKDKIFFNWFDFITNQTFKLFKKYKIKRVY